MAKIKTLQLNIRVSENTKKVIVKNARLLHMSQSEYIEHIAKCGINKVIEVNNEYFNNNITKISQAVSNYGNNLNQIARSLNNMTIPKETTETFEKLFAFFNALAKVLEDKESKLVITNHKEEANDKKKTQHSEK